MRAKYVFQWFPPIIEEPLDEIRIKESLSDFEREMLKEELGVIMFGEDYNSMGIGNPELPSIMAGKLGGEMKRLESQLDEIVIKKRTL